MPREVEEQGGGEDVLREVYVRGQRDLDQRIIEGGPKSLYSKGIDRYDKFFGIDSKGKMRDMIREHGRADVLDIGCGSAVYLEELENAFPGSVVAHGVSLSDYPHKIADYRITDAEILPYADNTFHFVVSHSLDQLRRPELTVMEAVRVLKPGCEALLCYYGLGRRQTLEDVQRRVKDLGHEISYDRGVFRIVKAK